MVQGAHTENFRGAEMGRTELRSARNFGETKTLTRRIDWRHRQIPKQTKTSKLKSKFAQTLDLLLLLTKNDSGKIS